MKHIRKIVKALFVLMGLAGFVLTALVANGSDLGKINLTELYQLFLVCLALLIIGFVGYQIVDWMQYIKGDFE